MMAILNQFNSSKLLSETSYSLFILRFYFSQKSHPTVEDPK